MTQPYENKRRLASQRVTTATLKQMINSNSDHPHPPPQLKRACQRELHLT
ncbi:hypothetical protein MJO29_009177 [Puccinia striiformis f. sp. tritici]|nr:hypothetical protein MJO29_009177 [Puccinia striiformis f. sp. tritici]